MLDHLNLPFMFLRKVGMDDKSLLLRWVNCTCEVGKFESLQELSNGFFVFQILCQQYNTSVVGSFDKSPWDRIPHFLTRIIPCFFILL